LARESFDLYDVDRNSKFKRGIVIFLMVVLLVVGSIEFITEGDLSFTLFFMGVWTVVIIVQLYFPNLNLNFSFLPGPKRDILTEFTNIVKQDVSISGFRDDSVKGFKYDYKIKPINMIRVQLRLDIAGDGWKPIRRKFTNAVRAVFGTQWYAENRFLLKVLEIEQYLGYEGSVLDILKGISRALVLKNWNNR